MRATTGISCVVALVVLHCGPIGASGPPGPGDGGDGGSGSSSGGGSSGGSSGSSSSGGGPSDAASDAPHRGDGGPTMAGLHVSGNKFVDNGKTVRLLGVDHSGTEYMCVQNSTTIFDGPSDMSLVTPMKTWNVNTVRVPLNEDCWLGINGVASAVSGTNYQQAIQTFVQMLRTNGMYVVVDLHWNAPGTTLATVQQPMPDADHAEDFWKSVAATFKTDMGIVFDLYNEPYPEKGTTDAGGCLLNGCSLSNWAGGATGIHAAVGMQQLINDVRAAGAQNPIMVAGFSWAGDLSQWLSHQPVDPLNNIAASFHSYNHTSCSTSSCWTNVLGPIAAQVPIVTGELGENDCAETYIDSFFAWADPLGISYLGWAWNTASCTGFPSLISDYTGTPTTFGQGFKTHLPTQ